jgi:hypothetical protein
LIYLSAAIEVVAGKMSEYQEIIAKEAVPLYPKMGMKLIASWHGYTGNMNKSYTLFAFDDLASLQKSREAQQQNKDYQKLQVRLNAFRVNMNQTILEPNSWSPMK